MTQVATYFECPFIQLYNDTNFAKIGCIESELHYPEWNNLKNAFLTRKTELIKHKLFYITCSLLCF